MRLEGESFEGIAFVAFEIENEEVEIGIEFGLMEYVVD